MKILITGGAGCLGSNLIEHWEISKYEICVVDNFVTSEKELIVSNNHLKVIQGDISDNELLKKIFKNFKPDVVINSAASYKDPNDWITDIKTNVQGCINLVRLSEDNNVQKFINFQTALCYGKPEIIPIPLDHQLNPFTSYGISKTAGEQYIINSGLPFISMRLANVVSPRLSIGPIPTFYKRLKNDLNCFCSDTYRDFLDIEDFFNIMDLALEPNSPNGIYNISSGELHSVKEIYDLVANHLSVDKDVPIVDPEEDDVQKVCLDPSKTEEVFNWKAEVSFEESINKQLSWYDKFGVSEVYSHLTPPDKK